MRYWTYFRPIYDSSEEEYITMSEEEIIQQYYPRWRKMKIKKYGEDYVNKTFCKEDCIDEWVCIRNAWESF